MVKVTRLCEGGLQKGENCPGICPKEECIRENLHLITRGKENISKVLDKAEIIGNLSKNDIKLIVLNLLGEQSKEAEIIIGKILNTDYKYEIVSFKEIKYDVSLGIIYGSALLNNNKFLVFYERKVGNEKKVALIRDVREITELELDNQGKPIGIKI
ncbi:MAG: hypothetical protein PHZ26_00225 [Candidatus Gracilibacteria bacterium]|nr:hypothetical protein [Candidatus Gracilibacteria bacterium]MDD2908162.1 hypothetical protein [Candidatus Gracilibacteria bacterium]